MKKKGLEFKLFKNLDKYGEQIVGRFAFEQALKEDLEIELDSQKYRKFLLQVKDEEYEGFVSL